MTPRPPTRRAGGPDRLTTETRAWRRTVLVLAALAVVVAPVGGCSSNGAAGTGAPPARPAAPDLGKYYAQRLGWGPCAPFAPSSDEKELFARPGFDCAYLKVPLDYSQPDGQVAEIAVARQKASVPEQRIGSLLVNNGGPGLSGTETVIESADLRNELRVRQWFDRVGFDPRGVGASKPAIRCQTREERDAYRLDVEVDTAPAGVARREAKAKDLADKCLQRSGKELLANIGTRDAARDLDILRAALGDEQLNFLAKSYATRIGYTYAEQFPNKVRAMVLDGAEDPAQSLPDSDVSEAEGFQRAFDSFAADCAKRPECPLGADPSTTTDGFTKLVRPLIDKPVPLADGRRLSYDDAILGAIDYLYTAEDWEYLRQALRELAGGRGEKLMQGADLYRGRQDDGSYNSFSDAYVAINCVDDEPVTDPARRLELSTRVRQVAPFRDDGRGPSPARDACAFWPVPSSGKAHQPAFPGLPRLMVVSVTGDPATPYQSGVNLAKALGARLLTVEGTQHTAAFTGTPCVDDIVTKYLITLALPPDGAHCAITPN